MGSCVMIRGLWYYTPDGRFVTPDNPNLHFTIVCGTEILSFDGFVAANRRESLDMPLGADKP